MNQMDAVRTEWSRPPLEDTGNVSTERPWALDPTDLRAKVKAAERERYHGWRNRDGLWQKYFHTGVEGLTVIDYGCGWGLETLALTRLGAHVTFADVVPSNVGATAAVLSAHDYTAASLHGYFLSCSVPPATLGPFDIFYANGVIHHVPEARKVMEWAAARCRQARLMLYNERSWLSAAGAPLPVLSQADPRYLKFLRHMDAVGHYTEWYDYDKLATLLDGLFDIQEWTPIGDGNYSAAILGSKCYDQPL